MLPKHYFPPDGNSNGSIPAPGGVATPNGMPIGGVDMSQQQGGHQLAPQQQITQPLAQPEQPPQGQPPQGQPDGQQGMAPAPQGAPMGNMLQMTPQGQTMAALGGGQPQKLARGGEVLPREQRDANKAKFLKDSKVKQKLYHGTTNDIKRFDPKRIGKNDFGWYGQGHYLTADPSTASAYTDYGDVLSSGKLQSQPSEGANVMPLHVQVKNPYYWPEGRKVAKNRAESEALTKELLALGHDSVIVPNKYQDPQYASHHEVVVFNPRQIKSAIGNRGTYDPNDPDITKAKGGKVKPKKAVVLHNDLDTMRLEMTKKAK
jgi:hypothetical protein